MRHRLAGVVFVVLTLASATLHGDNPPRRRPLAANEREAVVALLKAVDLAQQTDVAADAGLAWSNHFLKAANELLYVPFRVTLPQAGDLKSPAMYVRAVSRHDGIRSTQERSFVRDWLLHGSDVMARNGETVIVGPG